jgi:hypothetical protein
VVVLQIVIIGKVVIEKLLIYLDLMVTLDTEVVRMERGLESLGFLKRKKIIMVPKTGPRW